MNPLEKSFNEIGIVYNILSYYPRVNDNFLNTSIKKFNNNLSHNLFNELFDKYAIVKKVKKIHDPWEDELNESKKEKQIKLKAYYKEQYKLNCEQIYYGLLSNNKLYVPFIKKYGVDITQIKKFYYKNYNSNIKELKLPNYIKVIKKNCFGGNKHLNKIYIPSIVLIEKQAFFATYLKEIEVDQLKIIEEEAFINCRCLKIINLPNVEKIGDLAFHKCINLKKVSIPKLKIINDGLFDGCYNLEDIDLTNVEIIKTLSFRDCKKIEELYLPNIKLLGGSSFLNHNLKKVILPELETYILSYVHQMYQSDLGQKKYIFGDFKKIEFSYI